MSVFAHTYKDDALVVISAGKDVTPRFEYDREAQARTQNPLLDQATRLPLYSVAAMVSYDGGTEYSEATITTTTPQAFEGVPAMKPIALNGAAATISVSADRSGRGVNVSVRLDIQSRSAS